jgi:putative phosphoesterase
MDDDRFESSLIEFPEFKDFYTIGIIANTHGVLRGEVFDAFRDCDLIIHGGDIGAKTVLDQLISIAPIVAVRGNGDIDEWAEGFPLKQRVKIGDIHLFVIHNINDFDEKDPDEINAIIFGPSHQPKIEEQDSLLRVNPGSAGPKHFNWPVSVAKLKIDGGVVSAEIIELDGRRPV